MLLLLGSVYLKDFLNIFNLFLVFLKYVCSTAYNIATTNTTIQKYNVENLNIWLPIHF